MISAMPCSKKRGKNQGTKIILEASKKTMPQIEKPDDLQLIASRSGFFAYAGQSLSVMEISQNSLAVNLIESFAC